MDMCGYNQQAQGPKCDEARPIIRIKQESSGRVILSSMVFCIFMI